MTGFKQKFWGFNLKFAGYLAKRFVKEFYNKRVIEGYFEYFSNILKMFLTGNAGARAKGREHIINVPWK